MPASRRRWVNRSNVVERVPTGALGSGLVPRRSSVVPLTLCSREAIHPRLGAVLTVSLRSPALLAAMARTLDSAIGGRLELGLSTGRIERDHLGDGLDVPESDAHSLTMERYAEIIRGEI